MPALPKFGAFPGAGSADPEDQAPAAPEAPRAQTSQTSQKRAAKQAPTIGGEALSKREADQLRPWLVDALEQTSGDLDNLLTHTNAAGAVSTIWQLDRMEAEALADMWIRRAMASAVVAMALRQSMSYWAYYQAGVILFPRFWQTWGFYAGYGLDIPLPGAVRAKRQRKGQPQRPAQPQGATPSASPSGRVFLSASGGPAAILPTAAVGKPQARAAAGAGSAAAAAAPTPAPPAPPVDQAEAEALFMRHRAAVNAATDSAGASASARAAALPGIDDSVDLGEQGAQS